ncbi:MAG: TlpA family protein disulfide reductase [Dehalococcoidia bacterium]|nr:TlpA family protein disulfide reductase [Dehalococcoidia bacterium]
MNKLLKAMLVITLASVVGLGFATAGCSSSFTPTPGGNSPTHQLEIDLLGEKNEFPVDSQGRLESQVEVSPADGKISLSLDKGTIILDKDTQPLTAIHVSIEPNSPLFSEDAHIISSVYNLEPQGATFSPQLSLTLSYEPEKLPEGLREKELYLACYDGTKWYTLSHKEADTELHSITITTRLYNFNFTTFAILGPMELTQSTPSTPTQGTEVGNLAPDFQLLNLKEEPVSLSDFQNKPVMLNFWKAKCPPCISEAPYIQQVYEEWSARGLVLLTINVGGISSQVREFVQSNNLSFPVLLDTDRTVYQEYDVQGTPTTFFIDRDGTIRFIKVGTFPSKETIEDDLNKIMP